jgi:glutathione S-transferase
MKLYDFAGAPNPKRARMFLAEKGFEIPTVQVNIREREQFTDAFQTLNPFSTVPVLELDDGTRIAESVAICRYIEETHPEPPLMGTDALDKALVEMWQRRIELNGFLMVGAAVRNAEPRFKDRGLSGVPGGVPQIPALVERGKAAALRLFEKLDNQLSANEFVAGPRFTIADIELYVTVWFARRADMGVPESCANVKRWHDQVSARPSAEA